MKPSIVLAAFALALSPSGASASGAGPIAAATPRPIVIGQSYLIQSRILGDERRINVYLPEDYGDAGRHLPVLYLLDGGEHEDFLHIAALAQITSAYGQGQEMIVVGIEGVDRRHDLTSPSSVPGDRKLAPTSGGAAAYRRFLVEEVKPWAAAHFRTNGQSGLIGESLAGLFVLETLLEQPEDFSDYIAVSPSLWWNGGKLAADAGAALRRGNFASKRAHITFDTPAPPADAAAREQAVQSKVEAAFRRTNPRGLRWTIVHSSEGHATVYHPAAYRALRALYATPAQR